MWFVQKWWSASLLSHQSKSKLLRSLVKSNCNYFVKCHTFLYMWFAQKRLVKSISSTFFTRFFHTNVFLAAFSTFQPKFCTKNVHVNVDEIDAWFHLVSHLLLCIFMRWRSTAQVWIFSPSNGLEFCFVFLSLLNIKNLK